MEGRQGRELTCNILNTMKISTWQQLTLDPKPLTEASDMIHHGVQFISMVGKFYIKNEPDDSHTNMAWLPNHEVLAGNWAESPKGKFRFAMRPKDLTLIMYDQVMQEVDRCPLQGLTNDQVLDWVKIHLFQFDVDSDKMELNLHYDIPHHPTDDGAPYNFTDEDFFQEFANHRANADLMLKEFSEGYMTASAVRTWPHHFDHGVYIPVKLDNKGEVVKSFSIGLAIQDEEINEPYYYVTTWSAEEDNFYENLPILPFGEWLKTPFRAAILRTSEIVARSTAEKQSMVVQEFLEAAEAASLKILGL